MRLDPRIGKNAFAVESEGSEDEEIKDEIKKRKNFVDVFSKIIFFN